MDAEFVRQRIEEGIPGAKAEVKDTTGTGDHFDARVVAEAFRGRTMVEQHQMVYAPLKQWISTGELHALALKTSAP